MTGKGKRVADIRVHKGSDELDDGTKVPVAWLNLSIRRQPEPHHLVDGLGSKYFRNRVGRDDERPGDRPEDLPAELSQRQIADIYREEFSHWGTANLGTWSDYLGWDEREQAERWLTELVVGAFPEMKGYL